MADSSFRVKSKTLYTIEVNDKGETIEIDPNDTQLMLKFNKTMNDINKILKELDLKQKELNELNDEVKDDDYFSKKELETSKAIDDAYRRMRKAMDKFLGEGACQKIFGDRNYYTMFNDLGEALSPEFEKMGVKANTFQEEIINKYKDTEEDVL